MPPPPEELNRLVVYAGPSLTSRDTQPIEIFMDDDVREGLHANVGAIWKGVLWFIEHDINLG